MKTRRKEGTKQRTQTPRQVLAVALLLENLGVVMVTVGFVISKLRGVQIPANHNRPGGEAFDSPQDGKAAGSRCLPHSALSPPVSGCPGGWGPLTPHSTQGGLLEGTAHGGICSYLISLQVHLPFKTLPHQSSSKCSRKRDLVLHCHLPSSCQI